MLIARRPIKEIRRVALDTSSRTSACLCQILLRRHFQITPEFVPHAPDIKTMLERADAALMIGDPALASDFPGLDVHDLADLWRDMTGLPFVFAFWAVRREVATPDLVSAFQNAAAYSMQHLDEMVTEEAERTGLPRPIVHTYLRENIEFHLGERNLAGLRLFYSLAHELGLIENLKPLEFVS
jgi:chorismate dehydratase